jgi:ABC-2 type transport system ATP-binding protein
MIEAHGLTKRFGQRVAVDNLSFQIRPGKVTGFLGPNGAGKSTTIRMIMGLDSPTSGSVTVGGRAVRSMPLPMLQVGALLDARQVHPGRNGYNHLLVLAQANKLPKRRVTEVLEMVGLTSVAKQRVGKYSLGMQQRLGIAAAMLGSPGVLIFDEPVNGLDPEGVRWIRELMRALAREGRTVFVSSHLMSEMAQTADDLIVIGMGRLIAHTTVEDFVARNAANFIRVRTPRGEELAKALSEAGGKVEPRQETNLLHVTNLPIERVGEIAAQENIALHELVRQTGSLEEAYMRMTGSAVEYRTAPGNPAGFALPGAPNQFGGQQQFQQAPYPQQAGPYVQQPQGPGPQYQPAPQVPPMPQAAPPPQQAPADQSVTQVVRPPAPEAPQPSASDNASQDQGEA